MYFVGIRIRDFDFQSRSNRTCISLGRRDEGMLRSATRPRPSQEETGMRAMESIIRRLRINSLKAQVELRRLQSDSFSREFDAATTAEHKAPIRLQWEQATKERHTLQLMLELLERQQGPEAHGY